MREIDQLIYTKLGRYVLNLNAVDVLKELLKKLKLWPFFYTGFNMNDVEIEYLIRMVGSFC